MLNVKELCLGALTFGDASGYDLKKFFETTFSHFCTAGFGSIYPALAELAAEDLVCCSDTAGNGRPDRKLYHLTEAGRDALVTSLLQASPIHRVKSDFLLVMYFGHLLPPKHLETLLDKRLAELENQIDWLKSRHGTAATASSKWVRGYGLTVMSAARGYLRRHRNEIVTTAATSQPVTHCRRNVAAHPDLHQA